MDSTPSSTYRADNFNNDVTFPLVDALPDSNCGGCPWDYDFSPFLEVIALSAMEDSMSEPMHFSS